MSIDISKSQARLAELHEQYPQGMPTADYERFHPPYQGLPADYPVPAAEPIQGTHKDDPNALYRDAPRNADAPQAIAWMRKIIRLQTANEAAFDLLGEADTLPYAESMALALALAARMQWPSAWANVALQAEWKQAQAKAKNVLDAAEKTARRAYFNQESATKIIDAACDIFNAADLFPSRQAVTTMCASRVTRGRRAGGHKPAKR